MIVNNSADSGGGITTTEYGTPVIRGNFIADNTAPYAGGGMYLGARSSPLIESNVILRNHAGNWGGGGINSWTSYIFYGTFATIRNNLIAHNTATDGGGLYCRYDRAIITNNTIVNNTASANGGGIYALNYPAQAPVAANCVLRLNTAVTGKQVYLYLPTGSAISISYSNVEAGWPGTGNIQTDPVFVDPDGEDDIPGTDDDDFRLGSGSSCIDSGSNYALPPEVDEDLDGNPRFVDDPETPDSGQGEPPIVDMGCYEAQAAIPGDIDGDGDLDAVDQGLFIDVLAGSDTDPQHRARSDLNGDGAPNGLDISDFVVARLGP